MNRFILFLTLIFAATFARGDGGGGGGFIYGGTDSTTIGNVSDALKVSAAQSGNWPVRLQDGAGNSLTSQASGAQRALDVGINVSGAQVDPRSIRALTTSDVVTAAQGAAAAASGAWPAKVTDGTNTATVKAASTAAVAADPALVVVVSPNNNVTVIPENGVKTTYVATFNAVASALLATDVACLTGSGTKTVRVLRSEMTGTTTAGSGISITGEMIKRSTADTGGTSAALTVVPLDSTSAAATATAVSYTANPTLGTAVGSVCSARLALQTTGSTGSIFFCDFGAPEAEQALVLRGTSQQLCINLGAATITGSSLSGYFRFTEE